MEMTNAKENKTNEHGNTYMLCYKTIKRVQLLNGEFFDNMIQTPDEICVFVHSKAEFC